MEYNKLVRDKIPDIIDADPCKLSMTRTLTDEEFLPALNAKLQEELREYRESGEVEELADIEEVLRAILTVKKVSYREFERIRKAKAKERGAFNKKIYLEEVITAEEWNDER